MATYTTGKTFGNTTLASAKYSYRIRWSKSSVVYLTWVAWKIRCQMFTNQISLVSIFIYFQFFLSVMFHWIEICKHCGTCLLTSTVSSRAWIFGSVSTSSSSRTLDSDTDTFRRWEFPILCVSVIITWMTSIKYFVKLHHFKEEGKARIILSPIS